jgi:hypothetical protein
MEKDIIEKIGKDFGEKKDKALKYINEFGLKNGFSSRVIRCIVTLSNGDLEKLKSNIAIAEMDWRDIIYYAEEKDFQCDEPFVND